MPPPTIICTGCGNSLLASAFSSHQRRSNRRFQQHRCAVCVTAKTPVDPEHQATYRHSILVQQSTPTPTPTPTPVPVPLQMGLPLAPPIHPDAVQPNQAALPHPLPVPGVNDPDHVDGTHALPSRDPARPPCPRSRSRRATSLVPCPHCSPPPPTHDTRTSHHL